jgi:hypothetical protein
MELMLSLDEIDLCHPFKEFQRLPGNLQRGISVRIIRNYVLRLKRIPVTRTQCPGARSSRKIRQ